MRVLKIDEITYQLPESWNELSIDQLIYLANLTKKNINVSELKVKLLFYCLHANVFMIKRTPEPVYKLQIGKNSHVVSSEQVVLISNYFDFLVKSSKDDKIYIAPQLFKSPWKQFPCGCHKSLDYPGDGLSEITLIEITYLQTLQSSFKTNYSGNLDKMIGILFRDRNKPFDSKNINKYAEDVRKASPNVKTIAYWFYVGSMDYIASQFKYVFKNNSPSSKQIQNIFKRQLELAVELADNDVTKIEEVNKTLYYTVLYRLDKTNRDAELKPQNHGL